MDIQTIFGDVPVQRFIAEHLHRLPFSHAGSAPCVCELGSWDALEVMLRGVAEDVFAVRDGEWYKGPPVAQVAAARSLVDDGHTVFVRHAERHHAGLAELAAAFEATFLGPVNVHLFVTPPGAAGLSWHYDAEDVFIIQTQGEKEYSLRKNTVNPWPLEETLPADMRYEREIMPLMRVLLRAGDLLYIPCGYWHKADAQATGVAAISLAVGVMSRSAMDVYDFLRERLIKSLVWRQRLPLPDASGKPSVELDSAYRQLFALLADDLAKTLADPQLVAEFIDQLQPAKGTRDGETAR